MPDTLFNRLKNAWNTFRDRDPTNLSSTDLGPSSGTRPDRPRLRMGNEKSIVSSVYNQISTDVSSTIIRHVRVDEDDNYLETMNSGLNNCLSLDANIDQTGRNFIQDIVLSMFDEGCIAVVPVDTTINPSVSGSFDILSLRTAKIIEWYPKNVRLNLYNDRRGQKEDIILSKEEVVIIENPLYAVMNEPNSTLRRLIYKLNLLDAIDQQSGSGKLDLIIQLPYVVKTAARQEQAEKRRLDIEKQLAGSKYGIAYTDGTEKVTQLNRPAENNLMTQIQYLTSMLYSQLGLTEAVFAGTADEKTMKNYHNRTVGPILDSICDGFKRRFLTKTARSQGQSIKYFRNPFGLMISSDLATVVDTFSRNAIFTPNEFRSVMGYRPSKEKEASSLRNKNLNPVEPKDPNNPTGNQNGVSGDVVKGATN